MRHIVRTSGLAAVAVAGALTALFAAATPGGTLPGPLPLFPSDNWWNLDISTAPIDSASASYISFISNGTVRRMHPDFGGDVSPGSVQIYGSRTWWLTAPHRSRRSRSSTRTRATG